MRRRILATVVGVTIVAVACFFVPAALAIRSRDVEAQRLDVQREAAVTVAAIDPAHPADALLPVVPGHQYGLYDAGGDRIAGDGPSAADPPVVAAFTDGDALEVLDGHLIATLLVDDHDGRGRPVVLRVAEPAGESADVTRRAVGSLALGAFGIVVGAAAVAYGLTVRLTRPIDALRSAAGALGAGDFTTHLEPTGVAELDDVAAALAGAGRRIGTAMDRERAFSADASHQLRTPITAMRAAVEAEQLAPRSDPTAILDEVLAQTDRLEGIVASLLALARETHDDRAPADLRALLASTEARWTSVAAAADRSLVVGRAATAHPSTASPTAIGHVLDVLIENALRHGTGTVSVRLDAVGGGARITVADEGRIDPDAELFTRRSASAAGSGIGLDLARSLAEAEGGRLRLAAPAPTTFAVLLPGATNAPPA